MVPRPCEIELLAAPASSAQDAHANVRAQTNQHDAALALQLHRIEKRLEYIQDQVEPGLKAWTKNVPHVNIKQRYEMHQGPLAKGEKLCTNAVWPKELKKHCLQLPEFCEHLKVEMNKKGTNLEEPYRCVGRVLGMIELSPGAQPEDTPAETDVNFLIGMLMQQSAPQTRGVEPDASKVLLGNVDDGRS